MHDQYRQGGRWGSKTLPASPPYGNSHHRAGTDGPRTGRSFRLLRAVGWEWEAALWGHRDPRRAPHCDPFPPTQEVAHGAPSGQAGTVGISTERASLS